MAVEVTTKQKEAMATNIVRHARDTIISFMPFLNRAVVKMPIEFVGPDSNNTEDIVENMGTDGMNIYCEADKMIEFFKQSRAKVPRIYMHMIFHCIFFHPFQYDKMDFEMWDFAADVAVENIMIDLKWKGMELPQDLERREYIAKISSKLSHPTAENIYSYYMRHPGEWKEDKRLAALFDEDDHQMWVNIFHFLGKQMLSDRADMNAKGGDALDVWKDIGKTIQLNVESNSRYRDKLPGNAMENIRDIYKERYDYREFLKNFISNREEMKINQEEFDYIYYTYGMKIYRNMPLIEPLEYRETNKIHDLVIVIDTSGSCQGHIVRSFLDKTYTIIKESDSFFEDMNLHIIQCDSEIQSEVKITSQDDFDRYVQDIEVRGFGGTDFRPVFERVNKMLDEGEFTDFRGVIYLTDGLGVFPKAAPEYKTAFIII